MTESKPISKDIPTSNLDKWQRMADVVNQNNAILQVNLPQQFKKLFILRLLTENILTFLLQYVGFMLIGNITPQAIVPLWLTSGTACAFIFMRSYSVIPGILLGDYIAIYHFTGSAFQSGIWATLDAAQALVLLQLCYRFISPTLVFFNLEKFIKFIIACGLLTAISSFMLVISYHSSFNFHLWMRWWLGNYNGILILSLAILTWDLYCLEIDSFKRIFKWKHIFFYGLLFSDIIVLLYTQTLPLTLLLSLSTMLILLPISIQLGWCGVIAATFMFGLTLSISAFMNAPLFNTYFSLITLEYIQSILTIEAIAGLSIAIYMHTSKLHSE